MTRRQNSRWGVPNNDSICLGSAREKVGIAYHQSQKRCFVCFVPGCAVTPSRKRRNRNFNTTQGDSADSCLVRMLLVDSLQLVRAQVSSRGAIQLPCQLHASTLAQRWRQLRKLRAAARNGTSFLVNTITNMNAAE